MGTHPLNHKCAPVVGLSVAVVRVTAVASNFDSDSALYVVDNSKYEVNWNTLLAVTVTYSYIPLML